jgi:PAS domain S-box-containing protein
MEGATNLELFRVTAWLLALLVVLVVFSLYGLRRLRRGVRTVLNEDRIIETGRSPETNKDMSFVFNTFQNTLREITEKRKELIQMHKVAVERVRQMERYNECILESMVSGVMAFDRRGNLTAVNEAAVQILGWPDDRDPISRSSHELLAGSDGLKQILQRVLHDGQGVLREEIVYTMAEGERKWLGVNASPLKGDQGEMIGATLLFTDLTEVKELQSQVELKNRLTAMGEMSAGIAHEFRISLGAILGYARLIDRQAGGNEILQESAEGIISEVQSFDAMLADFLHFARPPELRKDECDLADIVREALEVLNEEIEKRAPRIELAFDTVPPVLLDWTLMRQAVTNLIKNALQSLEEDGEIRIRLKTTAERLELVIEDNGYGIAPDAQRKIFDPFFTTKRDGTGLGLAITQRTVLAHQGTLDVWSEPGHGTRVTASFPVQPSAVHVGR